MNIIAVEWLALHFGKALSSDLGLDTDTHEGFMSSVSPSMQFSEQSTSYRVTAAFFEIISNSLFTNRPYVSNSNTGGQYNRSTLRLSL